MRDHGFFTQDKSLMRLISRAIFALPVASIAGLAVALTVWREEPAPAIWFALVAIVLSTLTGLLLERASARELTDRVAMIDKARMAGEQIQELFAMTDMLQAAEDHEDAGAILTATAERLLPHLAGALYVFNNSRDRLDLAKSWNLFEGFDPAETLLPGNCWALKRGKPHLNSPDERTLCCHHHVGAAASVEVPMMARGSVHGLLMLAVPPPGGLDELMEIRRLGRALADSMSLALSNIALREKLRTQSLRDPLTGLYNRRYMEDALERYASLGERGGTATAVLMIDLDNFKRLNDGNGHAKGDAVLRDVGAQLVAALRPSDVVSRYGGEELVVILPNCGLKDAMAKAETLRQRIESLSEAHGIAISASFGVASIPEAASGPADIIPMADAALYAAKQAGKNCVRGAERRTAKQAARPRLATG